MTLQNDKIRTLTARWQGDILAIMDLYNMAMSDRLSPCIKTGINSQNLIWIMETNISTKVAMTLNEGKWANMHELSRRVYDTDGIAPTIHTNGVGNQEPKILCSRRTAEGKRLRSEGIERFADRELQPKNDGTSNAITTVQKDNLLLEPQEVLGWGRDSKGNVIDRHPVEVANTVTASKRANTQNYVSCAVRTRSYCGQPATVEQGSENYANSLTSVQKDSMVMEQIPINTDKDGLATTLTTAHHYSGNIINPKRGQKQMGVLEQIPINTDSEGNARTINTHYQEMNMQSVTDKPHDGYGYVRTAIRQQFRIRKLTERECFRLMGVDDSDIDIIQASKVSRSQQYKLAGNSIVVDVLCAIFDKMFLHTQSDDAQLKLF